MRWKRLVSLAHDGRVCFLQLGRRGVEFGVDLLIINARTGARIYWALARAPGPRPDIAWKLSLWLRHFSTQDLQYVMHTSTMEGA